MTEPAHEPAYPARLTVDYDGGPRRRGSVFLRLVLAIPALVILSLVGGPAFQYGGDRGHGPSGAKGFLFAFKERAETEAASREPGFSYGFDIDVGSGDEGEDDDQHSSYWRAGAGAGGVLFLPTVLTLLFVRRYPRWWFDWHLALVRFELRVVGYLLLLRDEVPALEEEQAVRVELDYPDAAAELGRGMPLVKWLLSLPHLICLAGLILAGLACTIVAWFAILFTGRHPRGLFDFVVGVLRWALRVEAYALLLITDRYPPFSLD